MWQSPKKVQLEKIEEEWPSASELLEAQLEISDESNSKVLMYPPPPSQKILKPDDLAEYFIKLSNIAKERQRRLAPVFEYFIRTYPRPEKWMEYAKFYEDWGFTDSARIILTQAAEFYGDQDMPQVLLDALLKFETKQMEIRDIFLAHTIGGEQFQDADHRTELEEVVFWELKFKYACRIHDRPDDHEAWRNYIALLKSEDWSSEDLRVIYKMSIIRGPEYLQKHNWTSYIRLWIDYALLEKQSNNIRKCREIFTTCLEHIPHSLFTFSEAWLMYIKFEFNQHNYRLSKQLLKQAIEVCTKIKVGRRETPRNNQLIEKRSYRELFEILLKLECENSTLRNYAQWKVKVLSLELSLNSTSIIDAPEQPTNRYIDYVYMNY